MSEQDPLLPPPNVANVDTYIESQEYVADSKHGRVRRRTAEILESAALHYTVIALVLVDSACVLADLAYTFLSEDCTPIEGPDTPLWLNILAQLSLAITTLFLVEVPVTIWALGLQNYNPFGPVPHAVLHFFDAVVILTTFILEVVLRGRERELASLLIILRMWRLVKLVQGIAVGAGELDEEQAKALAETKQELKQALNALQALHQENQELRLRITQFKDSQAGDSDQEF
ncbi:hypothetical protein L226DRAFT_194363 [Lentinus tigrinus ALCF2SS1-7]|uniref:Voltage-gated hydrogen channel 1 n=1 Tax=Lentinus tigrinus ALCF2SS1-6 TaxID=1328759 RepID=A0A5C2SRJ4_9APHY|nr:hypothetical protein L227DRAFT_570182 [Lentinus tigrinus ALCF2SS1-6]RPD80222.1 hypothetical protein L226DRAFT_194363 [Lentinus tigrinus ALCF2SS1-7]